MTTHDDADTEMSPESVRVRQSVRAKLALAEVNWRSDQVLTRAAKNKNK